MVEKGEVRACKEQHQLVAYVRRVFAEEELFIDRDRLAQYGFDQREFDWQSNCKPNRLQNWVSQV